MKPRLSNLMLVDDEEFDHRIFERVAQKSGVVDRMVMFFGADPALEYLQSRDVVMPDAIVVDINMPGLDGLEFVERAAALRGGLFAEVPFIMLTTSLMQRDISRASSLASVRGYLHKPLMPEHIAWIASVAARKDSPQKFNLIAR
ncbi:MAG: response regulator [Pseudomonadota bacterium]